MRVVYGAGVALIKDDKVLLGKRADGQGWCIPAGKYDPEKDTTLIDTAFREFTEETGTAFDANVIVAMGGRADYFYSFCPYNRISKETGEVIETVMAKSVVIVVDDPSAVLNEGEETDGEMLELKYFSYDEVLELDKIFPPSLITLNKIFSSETEVDLYLANMF